MRYTFIALALTMACASSEREGITTLDIQPGDPVADFEQRSYEFRDGRLFCDGEDATEAFEADAGATPEFRLKAWTVVAGYGWPIGGRKVVPTDMLMTYKLDTAVGWPSGGLSNTDDFKTVFRNGLTRLFALPDMAVKRLDNGVISNDGIKWNLMEDPPAGSGIPLDVIVKQNSGTQRGCTAARQTGDSCSFASAACTNGIALNAAYGYCQQGSNSFTISLNNIAAAVREIKLPGKSVAEQQAMIASIWRVVAQHEMGHMLGLQHRGSSQKPFEPPPGGTCTSGCVPATNPIACDLMSGQANGATGIPITCGPGITGCGTQGYDVCSEEPKPNYCARTRLRYFHAGGNSPNVHEIVQGVGQQPESSIPLCAAGNQ